MEGWLQNKFQRSVFIFPCLILNYLQAAASDSKSDDVLSKADCLVSCVGVDEDTLYSKSTALQVRNLNFQCAHGHVLLKKTPFLKQFQTYKLFVKYL